MKLFIFDIDETLWNMTAELNTSLCEYEVKEKLFKDTKIIFQKLKENNKIIATASKGWYRDITIKYLKFAELYDFIDQNEIFPTGENKKYPFKLIKKNDKKYHILNILENYNIDFNEIIYFDDNINIINNLKIDFPLITYIHCDQGLKLEYLDKFI